MFKIAWWKFWIVLYSILLRAMLRCLAVIFRRLQIESKASIQSFLIYAPIKNSNRINPTKLFQSFSFREFSGNAILINSSHPVNLFQSVPTIRINPRLICLNISILSNPEVQSKWSPNNLSIFFNPYLQFEWIPGLSAQIF